jgi:hypothetical protein
VIVSTPERFRNCLWQEIVADENVDSTKKI